MSTTSIKKKASAKSANLGSSTRIIRLELKGVSAAKVFVAGSFNDWQPTVSEMQALGDSHWVKELSLPPGRHEYLFVADGFWMPDPRALEAVPNPFGGWNSVLRVA